MYLTTLRGEEVWGSLGTHIAPTSRTNYYAEGRDAERRYDSLGKSQEFGSNDRRE
jgi:hypothetical protein